MKMIRRAPVVLLAGRGWKTYLPWAASPAQLEGSVAELGHPRVSNALLDKYRAVAVFRAILLVL